MRRAAAEKCRPAVRIAQHKYRTFGSIFELPGEPSLIERTELSVLLNAFGFSSLTLHRFGRRHSIDSTLSLSSYERRISRGAHSRPLAKKQKKKKIMRPRRLPNYRKIWERAQVRMFKEMVQEVRVIRSAAYGVVAACDALMKKYGIPELDLSFLEEAK